MPGYKDPPIEHRFKPGEPGNPSGSSRKRRLSTALIKLIEEKGLDSPLVKVGVAAAMKGDFRFWSYIFDRVDGPVPRDLPPDSPAGPAVAMDREKAEFLARSLEKASVEFDRRRNAERVPSDPERDLPDPRDGAAG